MAHVEVANVDETVAKVQRMDGRVYVPPTDIPTVGRFAIIADPFGASISAFTPAQPMTAHDRTKQGEFTWHELITTDGEKALHFYGEIFGWKKESEHDMGPMGKYLLYGQHGKWYGGIMTKTPDMAQVPTTFMYYVQVDDLDAALSRAKDRGAKVLVGPMEVPGGTRIVQLMDPQGAAFALHTGVVKEA
jgi:predicted enzyme related to lactoylglutathione lyase